MKAKIGSGWFGRLPALVLVGLLLPPFGALDEIGAEQTDAARAGPVRPMGLLPDSLKGIAYRKFALRRPGDPRGTAFGQVSVAFPDGPFLPSMTSEGYVIYDLEVRLHRVAAAPARTAVLWVSTPDLSTLHRGGVLTPGEPLRMRVELGNQFLVFVTEEESGSTNAPRGRVLLQGVPRSGRIESMFSHGFCPPGVPC